MAAVLRQFLRSISENSIMPYGVPQHTSRYLRNSSGNFAMLAATRRASFLVSSLAARRHSHSVCGGPSSSLSLAAKIAIRRSASPRVRFGLNASRS
jgi:hypothetical protein